jgi:transcriptional regulator with XRE-family HTH domain
LKLSTLYENIRFHCDKAGITGAKLCADAGISKSTLTSLKNGRTKKISTDNLARIAQRLGVSVDDLLGTEQKEKPTAESGELSGNDMKFVEIVSSLGRDMQTILDAIATDPTYRPKREEKFVEVVCPLSGRVETIHQVYYVHDGKRVPYLNNGCDNRYACAACNQCQVRVMESVR